MAAPRLQVTGFGKESQTFRPASDGTPVCSVVNLTIRSHTLSTLKGGRAIADRRGDMTNGRRGFSRERHGLLKLGICALAVAGFAGGWSAFSASHGEPANVALAALDEITPTPAATPTFTFTPSASPTRVPATATATAAAAAAAAQVVTVATSGAGIVAQPAAPATSVALPTQPIPAAAIPAATSTSVPVAPTRTPAPAPTAAGTPVSAKPSPAATPKKKSRAS